MSDPNMHYDGQRWLRYDGTQWLDAASGQPAAPGPVGQPPSGGGSKMWWWIGGAGAAFVVLILIIAAVGGGSKPQAGSSASPTPTATSASATPAPAPTSEAPAPAGPATVIEEGDWVVGTDIAAGTYRTIQPVTSTCYWGIYKAGTNKGTIIQNDIVTGGRPTVVLKNGQEFSNSGCGTFKRQ